MLLLLSVSSLHRINCVLSILWKTSLRSVLFWLLWCRNKSYRNLPNYILFRLNHFVWSRWGMLNLAQQEHYNRCFEQFHHYLLVHRVKILLQMRNKKCKMSISKSLHWKCFFFQNLLDWILKGKLVQQNCTDLEHRYPLGHEYDEDL